MAPGRAVVWDSTRAPEGVIVTALLPALQAPTGTCDMCLSLPRILSATETLKFLTKELGVISAPASDWPNWTQPSNAGVLIERIAKS